MGQRREWPRTRVAGRARGEGGTATVLTLTLVLALVAVAWGAASAVGVVVAHRSAQNAADLAALAAAADLAKGADACVAAREVSRANGAGLVACSVAGASVMVEVAVEAKVGGTARARARAGPG